MAGWLALGWWMIGTVLHWASAVVALRNRKSLPTSRMAADFSIVAPFAGAGDVTTAYVCALAELSARGAEVLICVATDDDGAIAPLKEQWMAATGGEPPLLVGSADTFNPKMNNVAKGLQAASREVVALCDAGIAIDLETLRFCAAPLSDKVGLVLALKAGVAPETFAAEMEGTYLNGHQARFLLSGDRLGIAVASGGVTLLANTTLQRIGNWRGFNRWIADDYSVVRSVRELGMTTILADRLLPLPLGRRDWSSVWRRQVRWARTRLRLPMWPVAALEPLVGVFPTGLAGACGLAALGVPLGMIWLFLGVHCFAWLAGEKLFLAGRGLAFGPRSAVAALVREALAPVLMLQALLGRRIDWRGADLGGRWRSVGADAARRMGDGGG